MLLHSATFSIYLIGLIFESIFFINYVIVKGTYEAYKTFVIVTIVNDVFNLFS